MTKGKREKRRSRILSVLALVLIVSIVSLLALWRTRSLWFAPESRANGGSVQLEPANDPSSGEPVEPPPAVPDPPPPQPALKTGEKPKSGAGARRRHAEGRGTVSGADLESDVYAVQVASFRLRSEAEAEQERLSRAGIDTRIVPVEIAERGQWFRVVTGSYGSLEEARQAALSLRGTEPITDALVATAGPGLPQDPRRSTPQGTSGSATAGAPGG